MKTIKQIGLMIVLSFTLAFIQCSSDNNKEINEKTKVEKHYSDEINLLRKFLSTSLPCELKKIAYNSEKSVFIIDGDGLIAFEEVIDQYNKSNKKNTSKTTQEVGSKVSQEITKSIRIYIYPEVPTDWKNAIKEAVNNWNNTNSSLSITIVTDIESSNIKISAVDNGYNQTIAQAFFPTNNGQPGSKVEINTTYSFIEASNKIHTITHELGHTFGLRHTDTVLSSNDLIPCTLLSDPSSVMFPNNSAWIGFSVSDNIAISTLYPVGIGTKKLYRCKKGITFIYSTDPCEILNANDGYTFDNDAGYLYSTAIAGTVPLYRSYNTSISDYRLFTSSTTSANLIVGYLFTTLQPNTTALYSYESKDEKIWRMYKDLVYHYFYTTNEFETLSGYSNKKIVGYVIKK